MERIDRRELLIGCGVGTTLAMAQQAEAAESARLNVEPISTPINIPVRGRLLSAREVRADGPSRGSFLTIPGSGYSAKYYDMPGRSVMKFMASLGYDVVSIDRPGYGIAHDWILDFDAQADVLAEVTSWIANRHGGAARRVIIDGHSVGGMVALLTAIKAVDYCTGVIMTGAGGRLREELQRVPVPDKPPANALGHGTIEYENRLKRMFGPVGTFDNDIIKYDPERDVPTPGMDGYEALRWNGRMAKEAAKLRLPVQIIIGEYDSFYRTPNEAMEATRILFTAAPFSEVHVQRASGHSIELHKIYRAHVLRNVAFAEDCRVYFG